MSIEGSRIGDMSIASIGGWPIMVLGRREDRREELEEGSKVGVVDLGGRGSGACL